MEGVADRDRGFSVSVKLTVIIASILRLKSIDCKVSFLSQAKPGIKPDEKRTRSQQSRALPPHFLQ